MTEDVKHCFHMLICYICYFEKRSNLLLILKLYVFLLLSFESSLYIWIQVFYQKGDLPCV